MEINDPKYHGMENIELVHGGNNMNEYLTDAVHKSVEASIRRAELEAAINEPLNVKEDPVNPNHYRSQTSLECIEAMEMVFGKEAVIDFCVCNAWKYIWRWKHKNGQEDLNKAKWYVDKAASMSCTKDKYSGILTRMYQYIEEATK